MFVILALEPSDHKDSKRKGQRCLHFWTCESFLHQDDKKRFFQNEFWLQANHQDLKAVTFFIFSFDKNMN